MVVNINNYLLRLDYCSTSCFFVFFWKKILRVELKINPHNIAHTSIYRLEVVEPAHNAKHHGAFLIISQLLFRMSCYEHSMLRTCVFSLRSVNEMMMSPSPKQCVFFGGFISQFITLHCAKVAKMNEAIYSQYLPRGCNMNLSLYGSCCFVPNQIQYLKWLERAIMELYIGINIFTLHDGKVGECNQIIFLDQTHVFNWYTMI